MTYCAFCDDDEVFADYEQPKPSRLQRIKDRLLSSLRGPRGDTGPMGPMGMTGEPGFLRVTGLPEGAKIVLMDKDSRTIWSGRIAKDEQDRR
ncbi:hypothetical protein [Mycobacterium sp. 1245801.1]|uniref:hypothetical protein n=1 Tax=Mycobacterium sp. 1245801.1 TaxID=1834075 RepID=UPI0007FC8BC8|nr:hypothetical protein [Mycobacterium sp. 1245801.1]OBJ15568.1 hypothetical protein A5622_26615 [Mycobacterium sp. 1245801.1]